MSDRMGPIEVRREQKVVPFQHEEDQTALLPLLFVRHPSQADALEPTRRN